MYLRTPLLILTALWVGCWSNASNAASYNSSFSESLVKAALDETKTNVTYDSAYRVIAYPGGDVPANIGVCSDLVIRAYRKLHIDLQQLVHEDMETHFSLYPRQWGLTEPDSNIDHRRVPNLQVFFTRFGQSLPVSDNPSDYKPGDLVTWDVNNFWRSLIKRRKEIPHIGIVSNVVAADGATPMIVHNIGYGVKLEDMLFGYKITGHYRFYPQK